MTDRAEPLTLEEIKESIGPDTSVVATPSVESIVSATLDCPTYSNLESVPDHCSRVVVVGGGSLIDEAKLKAVAEDWDLMAIPSIWGSGAEVSPIAVHTTDGVKGFEIGDHLRPAKFGYLPHLSASLSPTLVKWGCGDAWSHALEGSLSPLGNDATRKEGAELMRSMLKVGIENDPTWFALSADACRLQSKTSVGFIHGIAHAIEPGLEILDDHHGWGHARICSTLLTPVFETFILPTEKWRSFRIEHGLPNDGIRSTFHSLHDPEAFGALLERIEESWVAILRSPMTRTNSTLIRRDDLSRFRGFSF